MKNIINKKDWWKDEVIYQIFFGTSAEQIPQYIIILMDVLADTVFDFFTFFNLLVSI